MILWQISSLINHDVSQIKNRNTTWSINTPVLKYEQDVSTLNQDVIIFRRVTKEV